MITSHEREKLNRDLNQIGQWTAEFLSTIPQELLQDLQTSEALADIYNSVAILRDKVAHETGASKRHILEAQRV